VIGDDDGLLDAEAAVVAAAFHEAYERLAPSYSYETREASAVPWEEVPPRNRALMIATARDLLERGVVRTGALDRGRGLRWENVRRMIAIETWGHPGAVVPPEEIERRIRDEKA
jgi:hypothetical protein